jgi:hypothetical protein
MTEEPSAEVTGRAAPRVRTWFEKKWTRVEAPPKAADIFLCLYEKTVYAIPELGTSTQSARDIMRRLETFGNRYHPADYESESLAFNQAYFFRNLYKCLCVLNVPSSMRHGTSIVDLGAGAGEFALAWHACGGDGNGQVLLVDRSAAQLKLADRIFNALEVRPRPTLKRATLFEYTPPNQMLRLVSFVLCESDWYRDPNTNNIRGLIGKGAIIIDYSDVIEELVTNIDLNYYSCVLTKMYVVLEPEIATRLGKVDVTINAAYIAPREDSR